MFPNNVKKSVSGFCATKTVKESVRCSNVKRYNVAFWLIESRQAPIGIRAFSKANRATRPWSSFISGGGSSPSAPSGCSSRQVSWLCLHIRGSVSTRHPTEHFTIWEPINPGIGLSELCKINSLIAGSWGSETAECSIRQLIPSDFVLCVGEKTLIVRTRR